MPTNLPSPEVKEQAEALAKELVLRFEAGSCSHGPSFSSPSDEPNERAMGYCFDCWVDFWASALSSVMAERDEARRAKWRFFEKALTKVTAQRNDRAKAAKLLVRAEAAETQAHLANQRAERLAAEVERLRYTSERQAVAWKDEMNRNLEAIITLLSEMNRNLEAIITLLS
jgi:hypothetical protein